MPDNADWVASDPSKLRECKHCGRVARMVFFCVMCGCLDLREKPISVEGTSEA